EGMQAVQLAPAYRHHLGGGIQLHGAGTQRNHRRGEREVPRLEPLDVAQHLRLGVTLVEDGMGEIHTGAAERLWNRRLGRGTTIAEHVGQGDVEREDGDDVGQIAYRDRLVERHTDPVSVDYPQVDVPGPRGVQNPR